MFLDKLYSCLTDPTILYSCCVEHVTLSQEYVDGEKTRLLTLSGSDIKVLLARGILVLALIILLEILTV